MTFIDGGREKTYPVLSTDYRAHLRNSHFRKNGTVIGPAALEGVFRLQEARALCEGAEHPVFQRVGERDGKIYLDLADSRWRVVEIGEFDWKVLERSPIKFLRPPGMKALPIPIDDGTGFEKLQLLLNLRDDKDFALVVSWLVAALRPKGPYPVLVFNSAQGSGKTMRSRILRQLIDPHAVPVRGLPRDERDLLIAASHGWALVFDNVSHLPDWLSDALCRISTGGGFGTRKLYTDDEEQLFDAQRPAILNGIYEIVVREDLADRAMVLSLPPIGKGERMTEEELLKSFRKGHPEILGSLVEAVSAALAVGDAFRPASLSRMADFEAFISAAELVLPWEMGAFSMMYERNRREAHEVTLDACPIGRHILAIGRWYGTASGLRQRIDRVASAIEKRSPSWPRTPHAVSMALRRIAPSLRAAGLKVTFTRRSGGNRERVISMTKISEEGA